MRETQQLNIEKDYEAIFALSQFAFQYKLSETEFEEKKAEAERHIIWGWMEGEQLAAKTHLIPLSCYINGKPFEMGGISAVATWPEYRRQGMVKHLLYHALQYMKRHGQTISFLHPFSVPFYRKYGWELTFTNWELSIPMEQLKQSEPAVGNVRRIEKDIPLLQSLYTRFAKNYTGMLVRDAQWWKQRVLNEKWQIAVTYDYEGNADGYILYEVKNDVLTVKEMVYNTVNGWKLLLQFIANHDSMAKKVEMTVPENSNLTLLLDEPRFEQKIAPYFMARVVDVLTFLEQYPFQVCKEDVVILLHVEDHFLPENSGMYQLSQLHGETTVTFVENHSHIDEVGIHCTIQQFTSMFLGYKRPMELYQMNHIQGRQQDIALLEKIIPKQQTYFPDFY